MFGRSMVSHRKIQGSFTGGTNPDGGGEHAVEGSLQAIGWNGVVCMEMNVLIVGVNAGVRSTATLHLQVGLFQDEMEFLAENALNRGNLGLDLPPIKRGPNIRDS